MIKSVFNVVEYPEGFALLSTQDDVFIYTKDDKIIDLEGLDGHPAKTSRDDDAGKTRASILT